jgi:structural maintenance of chromosome 2
LSHSELLAREELNKLKDSSTASNLQSQRTQTLKAMESHLKSLQKSLTLQKNEMISLQSATQTLQMEILSLTQEMQLLTDSLHHSERVLERERSDEKKLELQLHKKRSEYENLQEEMTELSNNFTQYNSELKRKREERDSNGKEIQRLSLECRKINHKLDCWKKDLTTAQHRVTDFLERYQWLAEMKQYFHDDRSEYNFQQQIAAAAASAGSGSGSGSGSGARAGARAGAGAGAGAGTGTGTGSVFNIQECHEKLIELKKLQEKLNKKVNKKVMGMIDKAESESEELLRKKEVILKDKEKIESVIEELDVKKIQAIQNTWVRVNKDFGSIFSTLLPGTLAKLDLLEGCTVMDGLEVKVSFNGIWKESLTELSGGQRSLLALSLILALLLFKPAPMYILDEVDAALDLSHTQNIGLMLRTHFSTSQFIVVSLKEGMFNNANVIFRTRFVDGISTVMRTVAGGKNKNTSQSQRLLTAATPATANGANGTKGMKGGAKKGAKGTAAAAVGRGEEEDEVEEEEEEEEETSSPLKKKGKGNSNRSKKRMEGVENMAVGMI